MLQIILRILGLLFLMFGVIMVYDARILTRKWFGFGLGFIFCIIGAIIVYFNK